MWIYAAARRPNEPFYFSDDATEVIGIYAGGRRGRGAVAPYTSLLAMAATLGLDLSSQPKNTGLCLIEWSSDHAKVVALWKGVDDGRTPLHDKLIVSAMRGLWGDLTQPSKVGIDAPLGWPVDFVRAVKGSTPWPVEIDGSRKRLERRATDYWVHDVASKLPLSVTTDRIAYAAMRAAGILAHYEGTFDERIDRSGMTGLVCETYPDPAIRRLGLWSQHVGARASYKGDADGVRASIVHRLAERAPWLELSPAHRQACIGSDDCLDALICALVARAAERGLTDEPPAELGDEARREGWIHLPAGDFGFETLL